MIVLRMNSNSAVLIFAITVVFSFPVIVACLAIHVLLPVTCFPMVSRFAILLIDVRCADAR